MTWKPSRVLLQPYTRRADLELAGVGDGRHGFEIVLTGVLTPAWRHEIEPRGAEDWSLLPGSPIVIEAESGSTVQTAGPFRRAWARRRRSATVTGALRTGLAAAEANARLRLSALSHEE